MKSAKNIKMNQLRQRAAAVKTSQNLRHKPSDADLRVASEHAKIMVCPQYQAIAAKNGE